MLTLIKQFIATMKLTMERLIMKSLGLKNLDKNLLSKIYVTSTLDGEETIVKDNISIDDLAEAIADLTIEVKVLEAKVQRLSEFRDTAGYVPISESGGKQ